MKNLFKNIAAILLVIAVTVSVTACGENVQLEDSGSSVEVPEISGDIWSEDYLDLFIEVEEDDTYYEEEYIEPQFEEVGEVPEKVVTEINEEIEKYFNENYRLDVSQKLSSSGRYIKYNADFDTEIYNLDGGFYDKETSTIYLEENVKEEGEKAIKSYLMHLYIHSLIEANVEQTGLLAEGIVEAICMKVAEENSWEYLYTMGYEHAISLAEQVLVVDDGLIEKLIQNDDFDLDKHFEEVLEGLPLYDPEYGYVDFNTSYVLDVYTTCLEETSFDYELDDEMYSVMYMQQQLITIAYCRQFNPTEEQINEIREYYYYPDFEEQLFGEMAEIPQAVTVKA